MQIITIIRDTFGSQPDDTALFVLLHILTRSQIYLYSETGEDEGYPTLEHDERQAADVLAKVIDAGYSAGSGADILNRYYAKVGKDVYEMPRDYRKAIQDVLGKLMSHDGIVDIDLRRPT